MKELITEHKVCEQSLQLLPEKAIYWVEKQTLILGDLHLGKAGHFRKSGIPISELVHSKDIIQIEKLINRYQPVRVVFLGDLFHSDYNQSWQPFKKWIETKADIHFQLILGNHDILHPEQYQIKNLEVLDRLDESPFTFTHEPTQSSMYNLAGHLHPAIRLRGKGRQSIKLPCFYFNQHQGILPAFGHFTGTAALKVKKEDTVFAIADGQVIKVS